MKSEIWLKLVPKIDKLGAIRKDLSFGCFVEDPAGQIMRITYEDDRYYHGLYHFETDNNPGCINKSCPMKIIGHPIILSDCMQAVANKWTYDYPLRNFLVQVYLEWKTWEPYLKGQTDKFGLYLLDLLS